MQILDESIELKVYDNGDHTCIVWLPSDGKPLVSCRGFTIRRIRNGKEDYLHGVVGFTETDKIDPRAPWKFPLQRFMWWDYHVKPGDVVQYSVIPVTGPNKDTLTLDTAHASSLTPELTVTGQRTPHLATYFNKGIVAAQWVTSILATAPPNSKLKDLVTIPKNPIRNALGGLLRPQLLALLAETKASQGKVYAALYELEDEELISALKELGANCNLILANGAFSPAEPDENAATRAQLKTQSQITVIDRMVSSGHFAHNKFVIFCDANGQPQRVVTGSTNWTSSGLCTQANNALIIDDAAVAADFLAAWQRLKAAGNKYTAALVAGNTRSKTFQVDGCTLTPWFVKTSAAQDLEHARSLINAAKDGILFLFFNPGIFQQVPMKWTLLQNILYRRHQEGNPHYNPNLYIRGVVNQTIAGLTTPGGMETGENGLKAALDPSIPVQSPVILFKESAEQPQRLSQDVLVPANIKSQFHNWQKELLGASMVNIHSKVIVLDPFGQNPVLMTGSHNMGYKASNANDDNLVIVEGNGPLAAAYAINIIAIYETYRWNNYVETNRDDPTAWHGLADNDTWQTGYLSGRSLAEIQFWFGEPPRLETITITKEVAAPAGYPIHAVRSMRHTE
jgi:phosphatidylserine/phosphatidylglycerophosphate/cardiolipin synthase-like enzyme